MADMTWMQTIQQALWFNPVGVHNDNLDISSAGTLLPAVNAKKLLIQCTDANVRYTLDGVTTPSGTVGFQLKDGDPPVVLPVSGTAGFIVVVESGTASLQYQWGN